FARVPAAVTRLRRRGAGSGQARTAVSGGGVQPRRGPRDAQQSLWSLRSCGAGANAARKNGTRAGAGESGGSARSHVARRPAGDRLQPTLLTSFSLPAVGAWRASKKRAITLHLGRLFDHVIRLEK